MDLLTWRPPRIERALPGACLATAAAYYVACRLGLTFTFAPSPISVLWPANAILMAALLLARQRWWAFMVLAVFPAHVLAESQAGVATAMVLCWYVSNVAEALIGASIVRWICASATNFATVRSVMALSLAAVLAVGLTSLLDAAFVVLVGYSQADFWLLWRSRLIGNMLAIVTFVPLTTTWFALGREELRSARPAHYVEAMLLIAGLLIVSLLVFDSSPRGTGTQASLIYLPIPFLAWAALRFGPPMTSACFALVTYLVIWGAEHVRGPFSQLVTQTDPEPIQMFLFSVAIPLMLLAALIHERRVAEMDLIASQELFSTAFKAGPDAVAISLRPGGRIIEANDRWLELFRYGWEDLARKRVLPLAAHLAESDPTKLAILTEGTQVIRGTPFLLRDREGNTLRTQVSMAPTQLTGGAATITIVRDLTEQYLAAAEAADQRQQLTHLSRVAALTDFSSTLAHELNQPLTAILSNAQAAIRFLAQDPPNVGEIRTILGDIADADKRAGLLIHRMRVLMKKGTEEFGPVDMNRLLLEVLDLVRGISVLRNVEVRQVLAPDLPQVHGDLVQLQQLVLNLISNACEAMQDQAAADRRLTLTTLYGRDGTVQLVAADTGPGISPENRERVFEAFFTTKESGLGLGLAISRKIARMHGGNLSVESSEGQGAAFRLVLPPFDVGPPRLLR